MNVKTFSSSASCAGLSQARRRRPGGPGPGDPEKTLAAWKTFNKAMIEFNKKNADGR